MRLLVASVLLLMPLAGCLDDPEPTVPTTEPSDDAAPLVRTHQADQVLAVGGELRTSWLPVAGMDGREPTVAVTSDGTLFYAARDYSGGNTPPVSATQTPVMRSSDGGVTWEDVSPRLPTDDREPPRSGDPMVVADPWTDRVFQIELYDLVCNWLVYTDDAGASWTSNPKACASLVVDHQTITSGPSALGTPLPIYPNMVYVCVNQVADSHCARSLDGGLTFGTFTLVYPGVGPAGFCGGLHGHALVDPAGTVYLPREYCGDAYVAVSRDDGTTWDLVQVDQGEGAMNDPNMAFDAAGNVYYLWTGADQVLYLSHSQDQGATWSEPVQVSDPTLTHANHPSITAGDDGRIGFVYLGTEGEPNGDDWSDVTWHAYMATSLDALSPAPTVTTAQANEDPVYRGDCRFTRCGYIREFLDASIAPDGTFWGAFVDACLTEEEAKYDGPGDCNTVPGDYGQGNGHLAYVGHGTGVPLYEGERVVSGSG